MSSKVMQETPKIPLIRGSTALILTKMYQILKTQTIQGVDTLPPSHPILRKCVALDCMTAMEGNKIFTKSSVKNVIEYMEAHIPRLPQADIKKILSAQQNDAKKKLAEYESSQDNLQKEYRDTLARQGKSIETLLRMVAAQPESMVGSQPIEQQLKREKDSLMQLRNKIEATRRQESELRGIVEMTFNTLQRSSGERISIRRIEDQYIPATSTILHQ